MKRLYEHVTAVLNSVTDKFKDNITAQRYKEDEPNSVGIILLSSRDDSESLSGEEEWECMKLELHITCENKEEDIFENMQIMREFVDAFEECITNIDGLEIIWAKHLGAKARPTYINGYNLQVCKCIIDFNYLFFD